MSPSRYLPGVLCPLAMSVVGCLLLIVILPNSRWCHPYGRGVGGAGGVSPVNPQRAGGREGGGRGGRGGSWVGGFVVIVSYAGYRQARGIVCSNDSGSLLSLLVWSPILRARVCVFSAGAGNMSYCRMRTLPYSFFSIGGRLDVRVVC